MGAMGTLCGLFVLFLDLCTSFCRRILDNQPRLKVRRIYILLSLSLSLSLSPFPSRLLWNSEKFRSKNIKRVLAPLNHMGLGDLLRYFYEYALFSES